jgi:ABC-type uncharacterized transport system permease subunit
MEPELREFFRRIIQTVSVGLLWLMINSTAGIMFGYAFFEQGVHLNNILFYAWLLISGFFIVRYFIRTWRKKIPLP